MKSMKGNMRVWSIFTFPLFIGVATFLLYGFLSTQLTQIQIVAEPINIAAVSGFLAALVVLIIFKKELIV